MDPSHRDGLRTATAADAAQLLRLWSLVSDEGFEETEPAWRRHAHEWFLGVVEAPATARFPVIDVDGELVATAIGTLELGVPNPHCPRGRSVRLANVITLPQHRRSGFGTQLVHDVVGWARSVGADRVDLSATRAGQRLYESVGFRPTQATRMKLVL